MAECGLVGVHGRKKWRRGKKSSSAPGPDLIGRDFTADASNQRWLADITEFKCRDGKLHLAGVLDLASPLRGPSLSRSGRSLTLRRWAAGDVSSSS